MEKTPFDGKTIDNLSEIVEHHEPPQRESTQTSTHSNAADDHVDEKSRRAS